MCGVTGWVDWGRDLREAGETVRAMTATMLRRGPDAGGQWLSRHAALGHRRLSIIDLDGGTQPMVACGEDGKPDAVLTYSGEVYNHHELRAELEALGHRFRTRSDTEVVLRAYLEWGEALAPRLQGMFAFAVWDARRHELLLVRDRLGVKPLYHATGPGHLLFGSEPKAILANPLFRPEIDAEGITELFALPTAPTPGHGVYRGLLQVRPGHLVRFTRGGAVERRWWGLRSEEHDDDLEATTHRARRLVADAVRGQLESDVPRGFLLSGGIDSSALVALAKGHGPDDGAPTTYSVDFPQGEGPEVLGEFNRDEDRPYVDAVVDHVGTRHRRIIVPGDELLEHRRIGLDARDLPGWGEPDTSLYLLFRGVREHATVALSGEVADEVFGGYAFLHDPGGSELDAFPWLRGRASPASLLRPDVAAEVRPAERVAARVRDALGEVPALAGEDPAEARARAATYLALTRWLPAVLERKDRMSMATGLEARVPFADHHLVEYLWNVPWALKTLGGEPKGLLRRAIGDVLPERVLRRPKSGYPATTAPGYGAALRQRVAELVGTDAPVWALVDRERVVRHLREGTRIPGPRAAPHPTGGLDFLLAVDRWLVEYGVRVR